MSKGHLLLLWLVTELGWLFLMSAASELTVTGLLGQSVTLPCLYPSWSQAKNSMCWGKGACPKSKCGQELVHTNGAVVTSRKAARYRLWGNIQGGNISLTISKTKEGDSGVYCCRIEVPGWFNDVKKNIHLELVRAPTRTTTRHPTTTRRATTATTMFPTTVMTTPDPTTGTPLQTRVTPVLTATTTTCPLATSSSLPEGSPGLVTTDTVTEGPMVTDGSEVVPLPRDSSGSTEAPSAAPSLLTSEGSKARALPSTAPVMVWTTDGLELSSRGVLPLVYTHGNSSYDLQLPLSTWTRTCETTSEKSVSVQSKDEPSQRKQMDALTKSLILAAGLGFLLLMASLLAFLLRGKVAESNCLQKHKRLDRTGESHNVLNDAQREDEEGLFTL